MITTCEFSSRYRSCGAVPFFLALVVGAAINGSASADTPYSNNFESNTAGFSNAGVLPALTRTSLPTDGGGLASPNQSMWLGRLGEGIDESAGVQIVRLSPSGLTPGQVYSVAFDLLIGRSWDGAANSWGPDAWYFSIDGNRLVDTMFSNGDAPGDYGAYSPQRYSDTHYATPGTFVNDVPAYTGAEFSRREHINSVYDGYYGIYYFSHGAGNPVLTFTATGTSANLEWARYTGGSSGFTSSDEYWALDNVVVSSVVPAQIVLGRPCFAEWA